MHECKSCRSGAGKEFEPEIIVVDDDYFDEELLNKLIPEPIPQPFGAFDADEQTEIRELLYEDVAGFIVHNMYLPTKRHKQAIAKDMCKIAPSLCYHPLKHDKEPDELVDEVIAEVVAEFAQEGIVIPSYYDTLFVLETDRLILRKLDREDLTSLHEIRRKPEVMYAWEHGFTKSETRKWLNGQITRYHKDGFGCFGVFEKRTGRLIGMAGLLKRTLPDREVVELGYIFDDTVWHNGFCMEAVIGCKDYAFAVLGLEHLCCSIKFDNSASIRVAEKLGMKRTGEHIVTYREKDMLHHFYEMTKS